MSLTNLHKYNPLVLLGVPTLSRHPLSWDWADYHNAIFGNTLGTAFLKFRVIGLPVAEARNTIVEEALRQGADYVLFLGDDVLAPPNVFELLHRHREMMVTGVYWTKTDPPQPYIYDGWMKGPYLDWKLGEYFPVDWAGCDCLLVNTDVFRKVERPWFSTDWVFWQKARRTPFGDPGRPPLTEDLYFYSKAKAAGFQLYCDTAAQCDHQDRATLRRFGLTKEMPQAIAEAPPPSGDPHLLVADLGCGIDSPWFGANATIRRFDADPRVKPDVRCDLRAIPEADETFDIVSGRHILEHFAPFEVVAVVREWARILKVGGEFRINVPNLGYAAREILKSDEDPAYDPGAYPHWQLFGRQSGEDHQLHRNGFTRASLKSLLQVCGLADVRVEVEGTVGENLQATARKAAPAPVEAVGPIFHEASGRPAPRGNGHAEIEMSLERVAELVKAGYSVTRSRR